MNEIEKILSLEEARYGAMLSGDISTLESLLDDELIYTDSSGRIDSKESYLASFKSGLRKYLTIERTEIRAIVREGMGLVHCKLSISANFNGSKRVVSTRALAVWTMRQGTAKLIALHSTADNTIQ